MAGTSGAIRAGRAFVSLFADNTQLARDLKQGVAMMRRFAASARAVGASMISAGLKLGTPFAIATAIFVGFEDQMAEVRAVTQATATDFRLLNEQAKTLGRTTSFMAKEVAGAQTELGRAGFNPSEIMAGTAAVLDLARGTKTDLAQAAQIGADSLRAFRLEAEQMPRVADVLVATANNSSQGLVDLFEALKTVGPVAADVGASIENTAAAIGVLANNGIKGTLAGNALKRAYLNLANPAIQKAIEKLTGVSAVDSAGNLRPLATVITEIGRATKNLPNAKRLDIFSQIFGDRAVVAASAFAGSAGNFTDLQNILNGAAGTAARTAAIMDDTLGGSFRKLLSAAEGVAIAVGESIAPAVRNIADVFTNAAGSVTEFVKENQGLVIGLAATAAGAVAVGASLVLIGGTIGVLSFALSGLVPIIAGSVGLLPGLFTAITSPAKLATAAVLALSGAAAFTATPAIAAPKIEPPAAQAGVTVPVDAQQPEPVKVDVVANDQTQTVTQDVVGATLPTVSDQTQTVTQQFAAEAVPEVVDQTQTLTQQVVDAVTQPVADQTQTINQQVNAANVQPVADQAQTVTQTVQPAVPVDVAGPAIEQPVNVTGNAPDELNGIASAAASATASILPLVSSFAGLRVARGVVGGVAGSFTVANSTIRKTSTVMVANSAAARVLTSRVGALATVTGRTLAGALAIAHGPTRALTAASVGLAGTMTTTAGIMLGKVASGFDAAAIGITKAGAAIGGASRNLSTASRGAVLASTALTRTAGRASIGILTLGRTARIVSFDLLGFVRAMTRAAAVNAVAGLKATTQAMGGVVIAAYRATRATLAAVASIRLANVTAASATGFRFAADGMRFLSRSALDVSRSLGKAAVAIKSTMALKNVGNVAKAASSGIAAAISGLAMLATNPVVLFGGLAAGIVAAGFYATGTFGLIKDGFLTVVSAGGRAFGQVATQAGTAWRAVSIVASTAFGRIVELIKAGDMQGAFAVAMAAISLAWSETVLAFVDTWAPVKQALVSGWTSTAQLFGDIFGPAVSFLRESFASFVSWFGGSGGVGSMPATMADAVASLASLFATGWMMLKQIGSDSLDVMADGWDSFISGITNAWHTAISFIQKGWTRLKALFDSDINVEAEVKDINRENAAHNEATTAAKDKKIADRAAARKAAKDRANDELAEQLAVIEAERVAKNEADKKAIEESKAAAKAEAEARRAAFDQALAENIPSPVDAAATTGEPAKAAAQTATETPTPTPEPMTSTEALADWKKKRDRRDQLANEMQAANENGGVNPYTSRKKKVIREELATAQGETDSAMDRVRQARGAEIKAAKEKQRAERAAEAQKRNGKNPEMEAAKSAELAKRTETTAGATSGLDRIQSRLGDSVGTFSARAGGQIGAASTVMDRVAKAVEKTASAAETTAANTERIADGIEDLSTLEAE